MAHDFNNVLSGILGASQLLQLPKYGLNEKCLKYVGMIIQASKRASDLISKLLTFSRKGQITTTTLDIHEILDDTVAILEGTIDKKITLSVVKDTGCEIPDEDLQKIFEPFYTTKEQGSGTGLGLSAVYGTIQDHHGMIDVFSEVGVGTTFSILLPSAEKLIEQGKEISPTLTGAGTILLVDDEEWTGINRNFQ